MPVPPEDARQQEAQLLYETANRLANQAHFEAALEACNQSIALNPTHADAYLLRGAIYQHHGHFYNAAQDFEIAAQLAPHHYAAYFSLAKVQKSDYRHREALANLDKALALAPTQQETIQLRYECLIDLCEHEQLLIEAEQSIQAAQSSVGDATRLVTALCHQAQLLLYLQQPRKAFLLYEQADALKPMDEDVLLGKLAIWSAMGRDDVVYDFYPDSQLQAHSSFFKALGIPLWTGRESLREKTLLIYAEQGQGDTIQRSRYVLALVAYAKSISAHFIFQVQASLLRLMQHAFKPYASQVSVISTADSALSCDFVCSTLMMASALHRLGIRPPTLATPYLTALPELQAKWQELIPPRQTPKRPRIGLSWSGGQAVQDFRRSVPLEQMLPLLALTAFDFISLQLEAPARQWEALLDQNPHLEHVSTHHRLQALGEHITDFADTASALMQLDLLICVDTSIAHLAGALGIASWLITRLDFPSRLLLADPIMEGLPASEQPAIAAFEPSLWYTSTTIFRQRQWGHWEEVIENIKVQLLTQFSH